MNPFSVVSMETKEVLREYYQKMLERWSNYPLEERQALMDHYKKQIKIGEEEIPKMIIEYKERLRLLEMTL